MNPPYRLLTALSLLLGITVSAQSYTDIDVSNQATIGAAIDLGSVQLGQTAGSTSYGVRMKVSQQAEEVLQSYTVPGYNMDNWVTVEDWGWVESGGYWSPQYSWQWVGQDYFPPVYDEFGNVIEPERWESRYDNVYIGDVWVSGEQVWGITGTHQENQQIWVPDETQSYTEMRYNAPVIHQRATRSDANWVWEVPDGNGGAREVMRLWDGGLGLADISSGLGMTLSPSALYYARSGTVPGAASSNTSAQVGAEVTTYTTTSISGGLWAQSKSEMRPELVRLTRTEAAGGTTTVGQTQIAAKSASFGGVVTVKGDLKVQGVLRVAQGGDIDMGEFTNGPQPE